MSTIVSTLVALSAFTTTLDDLVAYTADGREVILRESGTWEFAEPETVTDAAPAITVQRFDDIQVSVTSYNEILASQRERFDGYTVMHDEDITVVHVSFKNMSETEIININGTRFGYNEATGEGFYYNKDFVIIDEFDNRFELATDGIKLVVPSREAVEALSAPNSTLFPGSVVSAPSFDQGRQDRRFRREGRDLRPGESVELRFVFNGRPIEAASRVTLIFPSYTLSPSRQRLVIPR
jgi:hypothetical protein